MGAGRVKAAVADAGPLIHLAEIGCLPLLRLFDHLYIPQAIWWETIGQGRVAEANLLELGNIEKRSPTQIEVDRFVQDNGLGTLHAGECESLYVCRQIGITSILTDDLAVREAAKRLQLTPVGSLGVVIRAYQSEIISLEEAERHILDLQDVSTLFVTRTIAELAIAELHQRAPKK